MSNLNTSVDFANIALYIPAMQLLATLLAAASCLLFCGWTLQGDGCAIRSASLCLAVCAIGLWRKINVHYARGADNVFDALRPAALVWLTSIVAEHLVGACAQPHKGEEAEPSRFFSRNTIFHACMFAMMLSGIMRAWSPDSENDYPFGISAVALLTIALVPPSVHPADRGPLCATESGYEVGERYLRTVMFSLTYTCFVYAAPPLRHNAGDLMLCFCRAAASSIWTLGCVPLLLVVAPIQCVMIIWLRVTKAQRHYSLTSSGANNEAGVSDDGSECGSGGISDSGQRYGIEHAPLLNGNASGFAGSASDNGYGDLYDRAQKREDLASEHMHAHVDASQAQSAPGAGHFAATRIHGGDSRILNRGAPAGPSSNGFALGQGTGPAGAKRFNFACKRDATPSSASNQAHGVCMADVARRLAAEDN